VQIAVIIGSARRLLTRTHPHDAVIAIGDKAIGKTELVINYANDRHGSYPSGDRNTGIIDSKARKLDSLTPRAI